MKLGIKQWVLEVVLGVVITRRTQPPPAGEPPPDADIAREFHRVMAMTDEAIADALVAKGFDLDELQARTREMLRPMLPERFPLH